MKKLLVSGLFLLLMGSIQLSAQNTVSGTITDKHGKPIPGAKVVAKNEQSSTLTELDGTFKLESEQPIKKIKVYYGGMRPRVINVEPLKVKLAKVTWWNQKPDQYRWFASLQGGFPEKDLGSPSFGLMVGGVKNLGWYVKGLYRPVQSTDGEIMNYGDYEGHTDYWTTGKTKSSFYSATGGFILRLWCPIHLYAGAGYAKRDVAWEVYKDQYLKYDEDSYYGAALDLGLMVRFGRFIVNAGSIMSIFGGNHEYVGNVGIGYCF